MKVLIKHGLACGSIMQGSGWRVSKTYIAGDKIPTLKVRKIR